MHQNKVSIVLRVKKEGGFYYITNGDSPFDPVYLSHFLDWILGRGRRHQSIHSSRQDSQSQRKFKQSITQSFSNFINAFNKLMFLIYY